MNSTSKEYSYGLPHRREKQKIYWFRFKATPKRYVYMVVLAARPTLSTAPRDNKTVGGTMGDMRFMAADRDYRFSTDTPTSRVMRPEYILLPDLAESLRSLVDRREDAPTDFFRFSGCAPVKPSTSP